MAALAPNMAVAAGPAQPSARAAGADAVPKWNPPSVPSDAEPAAKPAVDPTPEGAHEGVGTQPQGCPDRVEEPERSVDEKKTVTEAAARRGELPENFIDTRNGVAERTESIGRVPTAGYDRTPFNGVFIQSYDGALRLQAGAFGSLRWTANHRSAPAPEAGEPRFESDFTQGFTLREVQLFFEGALGPLTAHVRPRISDDSGFQLQVFWTEFKLGKKWRFRFGKHFIPLSREDWTSPQDILATEYSPHNFAFGFGTSYGAFARYHGRRHRAWFALHTDAPDGTNDDFPSVRNDLSGVVRWEWNPVGTFDGFNDLVGRPGGPTSVLLGSSVGAIGQIGDFEEGNEAAVQGNIDLSVDASRTHAMLAASVTWVDPFGAVPFYVWGGVGQVGVFVREQMQVYVQYSLLSPGSLGDGFDWWYSTNAGLNYFVFPWTNRHRIGVEGGALFSAINATFLGPSKNLGFLASDDPFQGYVRLQLVTGF